LAKPKVQSINCTLYLSKRVADFSAIELAGTQKLTHCESAFEWLRGLWTQVDAGWLWSIQHQQQHPLGAMLRISNIDQVTRISDDVARLHIGTCDKH